MPVSTTAQLSDCMSYIVLLDPRSVLDVGCGFGQWGFLCREHLDVAKERLQPDQWRVRIDGIEVFEPYIMAHQRALYSDIRIADIRDAAPDLDEYDLIIAGDVIEHLDKDEALEVIEQLYAKAKRALLINIPLGETGWEHPEAHGNAAEVHRSTWSPEEFAPYADRAHQYDLSGLDYGMFWCPRPRPAEDVANGYVVAAEYQESKGRARWARRYVERALDLAPACREAAFFAADLHLREGRGAEAAAVLEGHIRHCPDAFETYLMLAKVLASRGDRVRALHWLQELLALEKLPVEVRDEAVRLAGTLGA